MIFGFAFVRAVYFASAMLLFGSCAFGWIVKSTSNHDLALSRGLLVARASAALASAVLLVGFVAGTMAGTGTLFDPAAAGLVVRETLYGHLAILRISLLAAFLLVAWLLPSARLIAGTVLGGGALALLSLTSHAAAALDSKYEYLLAASDALHLLAAGFWVGGLVSLLPTVLTKPFDREKTVALLRLFSAWAAVAVAVLVISGTVNGIAILDTQGMPWSSEYLTWLAIKLVLAGLMIALALTNRFGLMPSLARGEPEAAETLPLTVFAELGCAALILLAVGILGLTAPMQM
jgi:putative copper resistance protein D